MVTFQTEVVSTLTLYINWYDNFIIVNHCLYTRHPMYCVQLLGHIDIDTREWTDGVLTYSARQVVKEPGEVQSWIVCDGDIDPEWIESLNSVLDDNR